MIWNLAIRRGVLTTVAFLVLAIFGIYGYRQMPVREMPEVEFPVVSVNVVLPGASPDVIETEIIEPLERQINTIEGIKTLRATAEEQVASIVAEFELWRDIDVATQDVRDRVERARRELPEEVEAPIVQKLDPEARPIIWVSLTGDERWDPVRMSEYARTQLREQIESIRGVGQVIIGGDRSFAVRLLLDPDRLAAHGLTAGDVVRTIQAENVDIPTGRVESLEREFLVETEGRFSGPEPFNDLIISRRNGAVVRLSDVGEAVAGVENERQLARFSGEPTIGLGVVKQSDANTVALASEVRARLESLAEGFPAGLRYRIATDESEYVEESIRDLLFTILIATALVVIVVMTFLRSFRGTLITSLAIPTSLVGGAAVMYALGFSVNSLTMLALILVIGIVVDDAIVVLESVYRHLEQGAERGPAARTGTTEVAFAAIANSLALAAVFVPVAFTSGMVGRFLYEFGLTITVTVFASTFTALTLTPMLCARILKKTEHRGKVWRVSERGLTGLERVYQGSLKAALGHRVITTVLALALMVLGVVFFRMLPTEFMPEVDRSAFIIAFETPVGATLTATDAYAREIEAVLSDMPEVWHQFLAIGLSQAGPGQPNEGLAFVRLTPRGERERHQTAVMEDVRERLEGIPLGRAFVLSGMQMGGGGAPLEVVLQSPDLDELAMRQAQILEWMRDQPVFVGVDSDLEMSQPRVSVRILRDKAAEMGLTVAAVSNALRVLLGEPAISQIERRSERYDVITEVVNQGRLVPEDLGRVHVRTPEGALVALANVVEFEETVGIAAINHFGGMRSATLSASTPPGVALGDALGALEAHLGQVLPAGFDYELSGQALNFQESFQYLFIAMLFAVIFVYLVLAAQFESFLHPFTILLSLPLATVGAFGGLWLFGLRLDINAFIGVIMLLGMATKNAILLVDYTNVLRARGRGLFEAAFEAAGVRFRPVIMTAISTVLGIMPIALGFGAGGEARQPLGVAVAAGLIATTFLTLVVIPVAYTLVEQARAWVLTKLQGGRAPQPEPVR